jgi:hypothetical protein
MQLTRALPAIGVAAMAVAIACSDSGSTAPDGARTNVATTGQTDTGKTPPTNPATPAAPKPDSAKPTNPTSPNNPTPPPDTGVHVNPSSDPRSVGGTVVAIGAAPDTANYQRVTGATLVLSANADSTTGTPGTELARATSASDGSFAFPGTFKPGVYSIAITPPAGSPYAAKQWPFRITEYSSAKVDLMVWLNRK